MQTLLIRHAAVLATMDGARREIADGGLFVRDGWIEQVGATADLPQTADRVVDLTGHVVLPGLVNAHHHLYQTLDRACPACQAASMGNWLAALYARWECMGPKDVQLATEIGLVELALSGCTTVADHQYVWPKGLRPEHQIDKARAIGLRFHLGRGFQDIGASDGGFAPDCLLERADEALDECCRAVESFHDPSPGSFTRVFVAPSSLRSVSPDLLQRSADLARALGVGFHMHLGETRSEIAFAHQKYGRRPAEVADSLGCLAANSWVAHGVHFNESDQQLLASAQCGICHCPSSNLRLASGIAPIEQYRRAGIDVGLGVDGAASNDSSNLIAEARLAMLLARVVPGAAEPLFEPRSALEIATIGSAKLLGRTDIGALEPGRAADLIAIDLDRPELLGGGEDPVASVLLCSVGRIDHSWVHGRPLVVNGAVVSVDIGELADRYQRWRAPDETGDRSASSRYRPEANR